MTRKDYVLIAAALARGEPIDEGEARDGWRQAVNAVTAALQSDNTRFDRDKFLRACGLTS